MRFAVDHVVKSTPSRQPSTSTEFQEDEDYFASESDGDNVGEQNKISSGKKDE